MRLILASLLLALLAPSALAFPRPRAAARWGWRAPFYPYTYYTAPVSTGAASGGYGAAPGYGGQTGYGAAPSYGAGSGCNGSYGAGPARDGTYRSAPPAKAMPSGKEKAPDKEIEERMRRLEQRLDKIIATRQETYRSPLPELGSKPEADASDLRAMAQAWRNRNRVAGR